MAKPMKGEWNAILEDACIIAKAVADGVWIPSDEMAGALVQCLAEALKLQSINKVLDAEACWWSSCQKARTLKRLKLPDFPVIDFSQDIDECRQMASRAVQALKQAKKALVQMQKETEEGWLDDSIYGINTAFFADQAMEAIAVNF